MFQMSSSYVLDLAIGSTDDPAEASAHDHSSHSANPASDLDGLLHASHLLSLRRMYFTRLRSQDPPPQQVR